MTLLLLQTKDGAYINPLKVTKIVTTSTGQLAYQEGQAIPLPITQREMSHLLKILQEDMKLHVASLRTSELAQGIDEANTYIVTERIVGINPLGGSNNQVIFDGCSASTIAAMDVSTLIRRGMVDVR